MEILTWELDPDISVWISDWSEVGAGVVESDGVSVGPSRVGGVVVVECRSLSSVSGESDEITDDVCDCDSPGCTHCGSL